MRDMFNRVRDAIRSSSNGISDFEARNAARAALEALREPTEEMEAAFTEQGYKRTNFRHQFKAAIDAALDKAEA